MSRVERDDSAARRSADPTADPAEGTAEVHSRLTSGGAGYRDPLAADTGGGEEGMQDSARHTFDDLRDRASDLGDRTSEWASRAKRGLDDTLHRVEGRLHLDEGGIVRIIRENPILATGLAFGVGFVLAGGSRTTRSGIVGTATGQLRGALMGGLTAAISQEIHELLDEHGGIAGLIGAIGGREQDREL